MGYTFLLIFSSLFAFLGGIVAGGGNMIRRLRWHARRSAIVNDQATLERLIQTDREMRGIR